MQHLIPRIWVQGSIRCIKDSQRSYQCPNTIGLLLWLKREEAWVGVVGFASMMVEADMTVAITRTEHTAAELR